MSHGDEHQVFVDVEWGSRSPEELADEVHRVLVDVPPERWAATWHAIRPPHDDPPPMAGADWTRWQV
jgi:hypothetical protein